jgi:DNA helicase HerA-like ATPase
MRSEFRPAFESLLEGNKIRIYQKPKRTIRTFLQDNVEKLTQGNLGGSRAIINTLIENLETLRENIISPQLVQGIITAIDQLISGRLRQATLEGVGDTAISHIRQKILQNIQIADKGLTQTAINNLREFRSALQAELRSTQREYPPNVALSIDEIIENLNNPNCSTLSIIQSHDPDYLREFAYELGLKLFENRRINGIISPLVSFIFDEADEFIPGQYEKESSYAKSAYIAEMLARRGRKFGLGIGICTQRTRYLKTSVMAQPHTYLISKMPRITDRQAVQEAFGLSEEMFRQTFKFAPGDWLIASYDAIGIKGVPIPIRAKDANERIKNFVKSINKKD